MSGHLVSEPGHRCGNCRHWDDGECMVLKTIALPYWIKRRVEWTRVADGAECEAFQPGRFQRADLPVPARGNSAKSSRRRHHG